MSLSAKLVQGQAEVGAPEGTVLVSSPSILLEDDEVHLGTGGSWGSSAGLY